MKFFLIPILWMIFFVTFLYPVNERFSVTFQSDSVKSDYFEIDKKNKIDEKDIQKKVSAQWKEEIADQFNQNVSLIKQIIFEGETDSEELEDFMKLFKVQRDWFDKTITGTTYFFDPKYNALMQKKTTLQKVAKAQMLADEFLKEFVDAQEIGQNYYKRLRLVVLYEINSEIQKAIELGTANELDTGISDEKIKNIVQKIIKDFKENRVQGIKIEEKVKIETDKIENELLRIKHELEKQKLETDLAQRKFVDANKAYEELEALLQRTVKNMEKLKKEEIERAKWEVEEKYKPIIEKKNKSNLDLQLKLKKLKQTVEDLKKDLESTNRIDTE